MAVGTMGPLLMKMGVDTRAWFKGLGAAQQSLVSFGASMQVAGVRMAAIWASTFGVIGGASFKFGKDFETAFSGIKKTITATVPQFAQLRKDLLNISTQTPFAASKLADFARIGGQLGVGVEQLKDFTLAIAKLGVAAVELDPETAAVSLARLVKITGEDAPDAFTRLASVVAELGDSLATNEARILNFSERISAVGSVSGVSAASILGIAGAFSAVVRGVESGSTGVVKTFGIIDEAVAGGGNKLKAFANLTKQSAQEFADAWKKDAALAFTSFIESLKGQENVHAVLDQLGLSAVRTKIALLSAAGAGDSLRISIEQARKEFENPLKLNKAFAEQMKTVNAQLDRLINILVISAIQTFDAFHDEIMKIIRVAIDFASWLATITKSFANVGSTAKFAVIGVAALTGAFSVLLIVMGTLTSTVLGMVGVWTAFSSGGMLSTVAAGLFGTAATTAAVGTTTLATATTAATAGMSGLSVTMVTGSASAATYTAAVKVAAASTVSLGGAATVTMAGLVSFFGLLTLGTGLGIAAAGGILKLKNAITGTQDPIDKAIEGFGIFQASLIAFSQWVDTLSSGIDKLTKLWIKLNDIGIKYRDSVKDVETVDEKRIRILIEQAKALAKLAGVSEENIAFINTTRRAMEALNGVGKGFGKIAEALAEEGKKVALSYNKMGLEAAKSSVKTALLKSASNLLGVEVKTINAAMAILTGEMQLTKSASGALANFVVAAKDGFFDYSDAVKAAEAELRKFGAKALEVADKTPPSILASRSKRESVDAFLAWMGFGKDTIRGAIGEAIAAAGRAAEEIARNMPIVLGEAFDKSLSDKMRKADKNLFKDIFKTLPGSMDDKGNLKGVLGDIVGPNPIDEASTKMLNLQKVIRQVGGALRTLGIETTSAFGSMIVAAAQFGAALADRFGKGGIFGDLVSAGASGIAAIVAATGSGSQKERAVKGGLSGAAAGSQIGGLLGGAFGPAGAILGKTLGAAIGGSVGVLIGIFRGNKTRNLMKEIGKVWGVEISEELAKTIEKSAKDLGVTLKDATLLALPDLINEAGGITEKNFEQFAGGFSDLLKLVADGTLPLKEGLESVDETFVQLLESAQTMGVEGSISIGLMIAEMEKLGMVTEAATAFIKDAAARAVTEFTPFLDMLNKHRNLTEEQAAAGLAVMLASFAAALKATGSLTQAMLMMPESFGSLISKLRDVLGAESEALNMLTNYYNFVTNNEGVLLALDGLVAGMETLASINLLTKESAIELGDAWHSTFEKLVKDTGNYNAALVASAGGAAKLLAIYNAMGIEIPPWLKKITEDQKALGISMEPPPTVLTVLKAIRDLLSQIAGAAHIATGKIVGMGDAIKDIPTGGTTSDSNSTDSFNAQHGFSGVIDKPTTILAGEAGPEDVEITPGSMGGRGGGGVINQTIMIDGVILGKWISDSTKSGLTRIHPSAIREY